MESLEFRTSIFEEVTDDRIREIQHLLVTRRAPLKPTTSSPTPHRRTGGGGRRRNQADDIMDRMRARRLWPLPSGMTIQDAITKLIELETAEEESPNAEDLMSLDEGDEEQEVRPLSHPVLEGEQAVGLDRSSSGLGEEGSQDDSQTLPPVSPAEGGVPQSDALVPEDRQGSQPPGSPMTDGIFQRSFSTESQARDYIKEHTSIAWTTVYEIRVTHHPEWAIPSYTYDVYLITERELEERKHAPAP
jgi:hypothetical protein